MFFMEDIEFSPYIMHRKRRKHIYNNQEKYKMSKIVKIPVFDRIVQDGRTYYYSNKIRESVGVPAFKSAFEVEMELEDELDSASNTYRLTDVYEMVERKAIDALEQAFVIHNCPEFREHIWNWCQCHEKILHTWNERLDVFETAYDIFRATHVWKWNAPKLGLPNNPPPFDAELVMRFQKGLETLFSERDKRKVMCKADLLAKGPEQYTILVRVQGEPKNFYTMDSRNCIHQETHTFCSEFAFRYNKNLRTLEIYGEVSPLLKKELERHFVRIVFDMELADDIIPIFKLDLFKEMDLCPETDPEDDLDVELTSIDAFWHDGERPSSVGKGKSESVLDTIRYLLRYDRQKLSGCEIVKVKLDFYFDRGGKRKPQRVPVVVNKTTGTCTIRNKDPYIQTMIHHYLEKWGVEQ